MNIVIGGGHAGGRAIRAMRDAGFAGDIMLVGQEPHLPYERPPLSKDILLRGEAASVPHLLDDTFVRTHNIALRLGTKVVAIDRVGGSIVLADGTNYGYNRLLLATGSRLRRLAVPGSERANIVYLRTLDDSRLIEGFIARQARILVVGGGFIGLEVAVAAAQRGCAVVVVEAAAQLLPRLACPILSTFLLKYHRARGIDLRLDTSTVAFEGSERVETASLSDGSTLPVDLVVVGIGVVPEIELAEAAGLRVDNGIVTDEFAVTSDPALYAAGDVTCHFNRWLGHHIRLEAWQNAEKQAEIAGRGMAGHPLPYTEVPWLWSDQGDLSIHCAGAPIGVTENLARGDPESDKFTILQFDGERWVGAITVNQGGDMAVIRRLLASGKVLAKAILGDPALRLRDLLK